MFQSDVDKKIKKEACDETVHSLNLPLVKKEEHKNDVWDHLQRIDSSPKKSTNDNIKRKRKAVNMLKKEEIKLEDMQLFSPMS